LPEQLTTDGVNTRGNFVWNLTGKLYRLETFLPKMYKVKHLFRD
jgi:hypothetical protein